MTTITRWLCLTAILLSTFAADSFALVQQSNRTVDLSNLRHIAQSSLIYASDHNGQLPAATDIWSYAGMLAERGGLEEARMWMSRIDPAYPHFNPDTTILTTSSTHPRVLTPEFKETKPAYAVPLGKLNDKMPATTPVAWTRGLQSNGTWAKHSPYGSDGGGYIAFIGGNVMFYKNLGATPATGELTRFDGQGPTNNVLEALPPGTRIGEYIPTTEEQTAWAAAPRELTTSREDHSTLIGLVILWLPFVGFSVYRFINMRPNAFTLLLWPLIITILLFILMPTVARC